MAEWLANNWDDHPILRRDVVWTRSDSSRRPVLFEASVAGQFWAVRINDFPDEPLYTLLIDDADVIHFDDWPNWWTEPPAVV